MGDKNGEEHSQLSQGRGGRDSGEGTEFSHDDTCPGLQKETWPDPVHDNRQSIRVFKGPGEVASPYSAAGCSPNHITISLWDPTANL